MNAIVVKLLAQLSDGRFHSGERIAHNLGVSRTTVWELVRNLESMGLTIFSSRGHGYCLAEPVDMLDRIKLKDLLPKNYFYPVEIIDCLESTNTTLMLMADKAECGTAVVAEIQTAGRGRLGRTWLAAPGLSLTFSMLWRFEAGVLALEGLSLVVGLACVTALRKLGYDDIWLKWPNDLLYGEKKVGGILIETQGDVHGPIHTVIGVGININVPVGWPKLLGREIGGLALQGVGIDRNAILASILDEMARTLSLFSMTGFTGMKEAWRSFHAYEGCQVKLTRDNEMLLIGTVRGVSDKGALLVETEGKQVEIVSGEVSLIGV